MRRLIAFICFFGLFLTFIVLNLDYKCDISFGFKTITDVPVYLTVFLSLSAGMIIALFYSFYNKRKNKNHPGDHQLSSKRGIKPVDNDNWQGNSIRGQDGSYGID